MNTGSIPAMALLETSIMKLNFLSHAIQNVWGDKECLYSEEVIMGGCMLMRGIAGELNEIQERMLKAASPDASESLISGQAIG